MKIAEVLKSSVCSSAEGNQHNTKYWGVLFSERNNSISAYAVSWFTLIEYKNIEEVPQDEFFSYFDESWGPSKYPVDANRILNGIERAESKLRGKFTVPFTNLVNHLDLQSYEERKYTRAIISVAPEMEKGEMKMIFTPKNGVLEFNHPKIPKKFLISDTSLIPGHYIIPEIYYRCRAVKETEDAIFVSCLDKYGDIRIGLHHSPEAFIPKDMNAINNLVEIPSHLIMNITIVDFPVVEKRIQMPPVHIPCSALYNALRAFMVIRPSFLEFHIGEDSNCPVVIKNRRFDKDDPEITAIICTKNQSFGPQRS